MSFVSSLRDEFQYTAEAIKRVSNEAYSNVSDTFHSLPEVFHQAGDYTSTLFGTERGWGLIVGGLLMGIPTAMVLAFGGAPLLSGLKEISSTGNITAALEPLSLGATILGFGGLGAYATITNDPGSAAKLMGIPTKEKARLTPEEMLENELKPRGQQIETSFVDDVRLFHAIVNKKTEERHKSNILPPFRGPSLNA